MVTSNASPRVSTKPSNRPATVRLTVVRSRTPSSPSKSSSADLASDGYSASSGSYSVRIPAAPLTLSAAALHRATGIKFLVGSVLAFATAAFIGYELPNTPTLWTQMIVLILVCGLAGIAMLHLALGRLLGRLRVDAYGVRCTPAYSGFKFAWKDLRSWSADGLSFQFRTRKNGGVYTVARELFSLDDQNRLLATLSACAGEQELAFTSPAKA